MSGKINLHHRVHVMGIDISLTKKEANIFLGETQEYADEL